VIIGVVRESKPGETRVAATPTTVGQLLKLGYEVVVAPGAGERADFPDEAFVDAGATVGDAWRADVVFAINAPSEDELDQMKPGATLVALLAPRLKPEIVETLAEAADHGAVDGRGAADLAGAVVGRVVLDGQHRRVPRGDRGGARVRPVLHRAGHRGGEGAAREGTGVRGGGGGLAAIGAAGSLGAIVRATDPRPEVADQVKSLGGEYLAIESPEVEVSATGYAKEMGDDYKEREAKLYAEQSADVDIVITTALIPGRPRRG
jgi:NAD(P) transhydrogenase subunit alpha